MTRDFFNMISVFFGIISFCLVVSFTIGFIKVETQNSGIESMSFNDRLNSVTVINSEFDYNQNDVIPQKVRDDNWELEYQPQLE